MGAVFQSADVVGMFVRRTDERQSLRVERRAPGFSAYRFGTVQDSIVAFSAKPAPAICGGHQHRPRKQFGTSVPTLAASYQVCCRLSDRHTQQRFLARLFYHREETQSLKGRGEERGSDW